MRDRVLEAGARGVVVMSAAWSEAEQIEDRARELLTELDDLPVTVAHH